MTTFSDTFKHLFKEEDDLPENLEAPPPTMLPNLLKEDESLLMGSMFSIEPTRAKRGRKKKSDLKEEDPPFLETLSVDAVAQYLHDSNQTFMSEFAK